MREPNVVAAQAPPPPRSLTTEGETKPTPCRKDATAAVVLEVAPAVMISAQRLEIVVMPVQEPQAQQRDEKCHFLISSTLRLALRRALPLLMNWRLATSKGETGDGMPSVEAWVSLWPTSTGPSAGKLLSHHRWVGLPWWFPDCCRQH